MWELAEQSVPHKELPIEREHFCSTSPPFYPQRVDNQMDANSLPYHTEKCGSCRLIHTHQEDVNILWLNGFPPILPSTSSIVAGGYFRRKGGGENKVERFLTPVVSS
jgi:hypothetical protein